MKNGYEQIYYVIKKIKSKLHILLFRLKCTNNKQAAKAFTLKQIEFKLDAMFFYIILYIYLYKLEKLLNSITFIYLFFFFA